MTRDMTLVKFLALAAAVGVVVVLAVAQVPPPWRGALVAWLIFWASFGSLAIRLVRGYRAYISAPAPRRPAATPARGRRSGAPSRPASALKVVVSKAGANGRRTV